MDLKKLNIDSKNSYDFILPGFIEITQFIEPSMELFYKEIFMPKVPAILKGKKYFFKFNFAINKIFFQILNLSS